MDGVFEVLRRAMKARKVTYAALAARLGVSEPTIKRVFAERDCKLGRLQAICAALDLTFQDVVAAAEAAEDSPVALPPGAEAALAADPALLRCYMLLHEGDAAQAAPGDDSVQFMRMRALERLGLLEFDAAGRPVALPRGVLRFRREGPLAAALRGLNLSFAAQVYDDSVLAGGEAFFRSQSRHMRPETARAAMRDSEALFRQIAARARRDRMTSPRDELIAVKMSIFIAEVDFEALLQAEGL